DGLARGADALQVIRVLSEENDAEAERPLIGSPGTLSGTWQDADGSHTAVLVVVGYPPAPHRARLAPPARRGPTPGPLRRSGVLDGGALDLERDLLRDQHAAGLERGVPGEAEVAALEGGGALEAGPLVAERVGGGALVVERDGDRPGGALDGEVA